MWILALWREQNTRYQINSNLATTEDSGINRMESTRVTLELVLELLNTKGNHV